MEQERTGVFDLRVSNSGHEIAYLRFPTYPKKERVRVSKSLRLFDAIGAYNGPDIMLDFDQDGVLVGMEIMADDNEEEEEEEEEEMALV